MCIMLLSRAISTWKIVMMRYAPILEAVPLLALLPQASLIDTTKGRIRPPDRAATLGMPGDSMASLQKADSFAAEGNFAVAFNVSNLVKIKQITRAATDLTTSPG